MFKYIGLGRTYHLPIPFSLKKNSPLSDRACKQSNFLNLSRANIAEKTLGVESLIYRANRHCNFSCAPPPQILSRIRSNPSSGKSKKENSRALIEVALGKHRALSRFFLSHPRVYIHIAEGFFLSNRFFPHALVLACVGGGARLFCASQGVSALLMHITGRYTTSSFSRLSRVINECRGRSPRRGSMEMLCIAHADASMEPSCETQSSASRLRIYSSLCSLREKCGFPDAYYLSRAVGFRCRFVANSIRGGGFF